MSITASSTEDEIAQAIQSEQGSGGLEDLYQNLVKLVSDSETTELNPLSIIPLLLRHELQNEVWATKILHLVAQHANAKETLIALSEALEINHPLYEEANEIEEKTSSSMAEYAPVRLALVMDLYRSCIPRLVIRKKPPFDTLRPIIVNLMASMSSIQWAKSSSSMLILSTHDLTVASYEWASAFELDKGTNGLELQKLLLHAITCAADHVSENVAQLTFEKLYPHYRLPTVSFGPGMASDSDMSSLISKCMDTLVILSPESLDKKLAYPTSADRNSLAFFMLLVHYNLPQRPDSARANLELPLFTTFLTTRVLLPGLTSNTGTEEILAYLLYVTAPSHAIAMSETKDGVMSEESLSILVETLSPLASIHPSPTIRHIAFRILSTILSPTEPSPILPVPPPNLNEKPSPYDSIAAVRLFHIVSLIEESPFPQMRSAAIGILRSAVLSALAKSSLSSAQTLQWANLFASSVMLETISTVILRFHSMSLREPEGGPEGVIPSATVDLEDDDSDLVKRFAESVEPARLVESLNFYWAVLRTDRANLTGIRSNDHIRETEALFLSPLRETLMEWQENESEEVSFVLNTSLSTLCMAMERVDLEVEEMELNQKV